MHPCREWITILYLASETRIVRNGLIQAPTRPEKDTLWHEDQKAHVLRE
jgi:hypothetical protein